MGGCALITPVYLEIALFSGARSGAKNKTDSAGFLTEISVQKVDLLFLECLVQRGIDAQRDVNILVAHLIAGGENVYAQKVHQDGKGGFLLGGVHAAADGCTVSIGGTLGIAGGGSIKVFILWLAMLALADTDAIAIAAIHALFIGTPEITLLSVARLPGVWYTIPRQAHYRF